MGESQIEVIPSLMFKKKFTISLLKPNLETCAFAQGRASAFRECYTGTTCFSMFSISVKTSPPSPSVPPAKMSEKENELCLALLRASVH